MPSDSSLRMQWRRIQRHPAFQGIKKPLRSAVELVPLAWRRATSQRRQLPSAVIVGAQKAGTTQLYAHLISHPRIVAAWKKEVSYFTKHADRSLAWYQSHFPLRSDLKARGGLAIESSPSYLPTPSALQRMHEALPNAKIIVLLRDPVERAFSHYQHRRLRGGELRPFAQTIDDELADHAAGSESDDSFLGYVSRGYYALQLQHLQRFYPCERTLIIDSAELFRNTPAVCQDVFCFLGVEPCLINARKIYNRGYYKESVDGETARRLAEHYWPHDERLAALLQRRFEWMDAAGRRAA